VTVLPAAAKNQEQYGDEQNQAHGDLLPKWCAYRHERNDDTDEREDVAHAFPSLPSATIAQIVAGVVDLDQSRSVL
jgi:hypothetical protein